MRLDLKDRKEGWGGAQTSPEFRPQKPHFKARMVTLIILKLKWQRSLASQSDLLSVLQASESPCLKR